MHWLNIDQIDFQKNRYTSPAKGKIVVFSQLTLDRENNKYEEDMVKGHWQISSLTYEMLVCAYLCIIRISRYFHSIVTNPLYRSQPGFSD